MLYLSGEPAAATWPPRKSQHVSSSLASSYAWQSRGQEESVAPHLFLNLRPSGFLSPFFFTTPLGGGNRLSQAQRPVLYCF